MNNTRTQQLDAWTITTLAIIAVAPIISNGATLIGVVLFLIWLFKYRSFPINWKTAVGKLSIVLLVYFFTILLVTLINEQSFIALKSIAAVSQFLYLGLLLPFLAVKIKPISTSTIGCLATGATLVCFGLALIEYQFFRDFNVGFVLDISEHIRPKWIGLFGGERVALFTGNPNTLATILFPLAFLSVAGWQDKTFTWKTLSIVAVITGIVTTGVFAGTRMTIMITPLLLAIVWFYLLVVDRRSAYWFIALLLTIILLIFSQWESISSSSIVQRLLNLWIEISSETDAVYDSSFSQRKIMLESSWAAFVDSPVIGHGAHNKYEAIRSYFAGTILEGSSYRTSHNIYATHAAVGGIIGLTSLFTVILFPIYIVVRFSKIAKSSDIFIATVFTLSIMGLGVSEAMFFNDAKNTHYIILWFIFAHILDSHRKR